MQLGIFHSIWQATNVICMTLPLHFYGHGYYATCDQGRTKYLEDLYQIQSRASLPSCPGVY